MVGDVSKMYHSVKIDKLGQHTHRYLWRDLDETKQPDTYVMLVVSFRDKPASTVAFLNTAWMAKEEYPQVYEFIRRNIYVIYYL